MKVKLYLHGHLRDKVKKDFVEVTAETLFEALNQLAHRYQKELKAPLDIGKWKIKIKDYDTKESLFVPIYTEEVHIYPIFRTAKSSWATIAIGAVMVAAVVFTGGLGAIATGFAAGASLTATATAVGYSMVLSMGMSLMLTGVMNLLFPQPTLNTSTESGTNSKYLGAHGNTAASGTRIPFGYGLFKVAGHFISYNITSNLLVNVTED